MLLSSFLKKGSNTFQIDLLFLGWFRFSRIREVETWNLKCNGTEVHKCV
jgi:hypothetical protein